MKKKIIITLISLMGFVGTSTFAGANQEPQDQASCQYGQCSAYKDNGERCRNCCQQYSFYCWTHR